MTKRKLEKELTENAAPESRQMDDVSEISKESMKEPKRRKTKTRDDASATIEVIAKLDKESIQKLQRQRETLIAQGASKSYPLQNSVSPKLYDAIGQLSLLNGATDEEFDMEKEQELKRFAQRLEKSEKAALELLAQQRIHGVRDDDEKHDADNQSQPKLLELASLFYDNGKRR